MHICWQILVRFGAPSCGALIQTKISVISCFPSPQCHHVTTFQNFVLGDADAYAQSLYTLVLLYLCMWPIKNKQKRSRPYQKYNQKMSRFKKYQLFFVRFFPICLLLNIKKSSYPIKNSSLEKSPRGRLV
jgi:hypothetical protein